MSAGLLAAALVLDAALGEPRWLWSRLPHPAIVIGRAIDRADRRLNAGRARRLKGALTVATLIIVAGGVGLALAALPGGPVWEIVAAAILLAQRSLVDHVGDVATALRSSLSEGRRAVGHIVGRDTAGMDEADVARAAIESAAENLSDGVIAPAFWFLVAGLPGMLVYKAVNTADSMIGYRTDRHAEFGWAAARLDDGLSWLPARLSAVLILAVHGRIGALDAIRPDAALHRSPNAGWPEAAMARALDVALSGPRSYAGRRTDDPFVHPDGRRTLWAGDVERAVAALWRVWAGGLALTLTLAAIDAVA